MIKKIRRLLINTKNIQRSSYLWNIIAYTGSSFQSMLLMLIISRKGNITDVAIASIAFTAASMMLLIGKYAIRNFQVSDTRSEYTYGDYMHARVITILWMILASAFYLVFCYFCKEYSVSKVVCVMLIMGFRFLEAIEDTLHADLQRQGRLDIAAKVWAIRIWGYIVCFAALYWMTGKIVAAAAVSLIFAAIVCILLNHAVYDLFPKDRRYDQKKVWKVIRSCFPLAVSTFTLSYIANSTKYAVDAVSTSEEQACFNIVCMPVFVITLLSNYIYNPIVKNIAVLWHEQQIAKMKRIVIGQVMVLVVFAGVVALCGKWFGVSLLGLLYQVNLDQYETEFVLLMIAGAAIAIFNLLIVVSTVIRRQKILIYISLVFSVLLLLGNKWILLHLGMRGMCIFYAVVLTCMAVLTLILDIKYINDGDMKR